VMGAKPNPQWASAAADRPPTTMPPDLQYPAVPAPAPTNQMTQFSLPIRIVCGSDEPVAGFVPDPDVIPGDMNRAGSPIDTSTPNAAPAAVYQGEHYGNDFTYAFPVPPGHRYLVRLHFAEIFDSGIGARLENIYVNRRQVLTNLDIFAAAGGKDKALVREFPNLRPNRQGEITIRVTTTPDSPDKNAKISAIEILEADQTSAAPSANPGQATRPPTASVPPLEVPLANGSGSFTIDTSAAPELADWAQHQLAPVLAAWYPKIVALLPSEGYTAPAHFHLTIKPMDGVAYTSGTEVVASSSWCASQIKGEAVGSLIHELVHVVQQYHGHSPGWLVEGMADYVRWFLYEPQSHGADLVWMRQRGRNFSPRYDASYRVTANFLDWAATKYDAKLGPEVNAVLREGKYAEDFWKQHTGKTVQELGAEWKQEIQNQLTKT